jgi:hypothetical protein
MKDFSYRARGNGYGALGIGLDSVIRKFVLLTKTSEKIIAYTNENCAIFRVVKTLVFGINNAKLRETGFPLHAPCSMPHAIRLISISNEEFKSMKHLNTAGNE